MRNPIRGYLRSYAPSDRYMIWHDSRSAVLYGVFNGLAIPFINVVGRKLGLDAPMLAALSVMGYLGLLLHFWTGHLSSRGDKAAWVFWPGLVSRSIIALSGLASAPLPYLAAMGAYQVICNLGVPAYSAIMRSNYSDEARPRAMGHIRVMIQLISAGCAAAAGWAMDAAPWAYRIVFPLAGAAGIASSLLFFKVKARGEGRGRAASAEKEKGLRESLSGIGQDKAFLVFMAIFFVIGFPDKLIAAVEPIRLVDELGFDYRATGIVLGTVPLVAGLLGYLALTKLARRLDPFLLLAATALLGSARYANIALAASPYVLVPGSFLAGLANAGWDLLPLFTIMSFCPRERLSLYMGFHNGLVGLRGVIGPFLGSWLYGEAGIRIVSLYWAGFGLSLSGAALLILFTAARRRSTGAPTATA
jgi:hypothetical protein